MEKLTKEIGLKMHGQKIYLTATYSVDWYTGKIDREAYKIFVKDDSHVYLMRARASKMGYGLERFENPMFELRK